jgi:hypothetical protein
MKNTLNCYRFLHEHAQNSQKRDNVRMGDAQKKYDIDTELDSDIDNIFNALADGNLRTVQGPARTANSKICKKMNAGNSSNILKYIDISHVSSKKAEQHEHLLYCACGGNLIQHQRTGSETCVKCGLVRYFCGDPGPENVWNGTAFNKSVGYTYKRENHMWSWILRIQAKETITIPQKLFEDMKTEFVKMQLDRNDPGVVTTDRIRHMLKGLKMQKHYNNVHLLRYMLCGVKPPQMTEKQEHDVLAMFSDVIKMYDILQKKQLVARSNMLSYSYVLQKELELLEYDEFIPQLKLLKHRDRLVEQEAIWKKICELSQLELPTDTFVFQETIKFK